MTVAVNITTLEEIDLVDVKIKTGYNEALSFNGSSFDYVPSGIFYYAGRYYDLTRKNEEPPFSYDGKEHGYKAQEFPNYRRFVYPAFKFSTKFQMDADGVAWNFFSDTFTMVEIERRILDLNLIYHRPYNINYYRTQVSFGIGSSPMNTGALNVNAMITGDTGKNIANEMIGDPLVRPDGDAYMRMPQEAITGYTNTFNIPNKDYPSLPNADVYKDFFKPTFDFAFYNIGPILFAELDGIWRGTSYETDGNTMLSVAK